MEKMNGGFTSGTRTVCIQLIKPKKATVAKIPNSICDRMEEGEKN